MFCTCWAVSTKDYCATSICRPFWPPRPKDETSEGDGWRAAVAKAQLPSINFHGLRHTWASLAVQAGVPLIVVAKNLGHSGTRMVKKHYGHLAKSYMADAIRAGAPQF